MLITIENDKEFVAFDSELQVLTFYDLDDNIDWTANLTDKENNNLSKLIVDFSLEVGKYRDR